MGSQTKVSGSNRLLIPVLTNVIKKEVFKVKPITGNRIKLFNNLDNMTPTLIPKLSF